MTCDLPCVSYMALYIVSMHIINANSRTSNHWKLNLEEGKVQARATVADSSPDESDSQSDEKETETKDDPADIDHDHVFKILTSATSNDGIWYVNDNGDDVTDDDEYCKQCNNDLKQLEHFKTGKSGTETDQRHSSDSVIQPPLPSSNLSSDVKNGHTLTCGKPVNFTKYDHLRGIASRDSHPLMPEPEVAMIFRKKGSRNSEVNMNNLEKRLRKSLKEKPNSVQVYNHIGNFWRIKGHTQLAIECFRKALAINANHPDILLNLGRVLFNLHYLEDAIYLTRQSLSNQSPRDNSWLQHFTLGEILKAYGHFHEATLHFQHTLQLNPSFPPAIAHLREMQVNPDSTVTYYTLFIIMFLVMGVLCGILTSLDSSLEDFGSETSKIQRHFNRAMAMKSMRQGINPRIIRSRKLNNC